MEAAREYRAKVEDRLDGYEAMLSKTRFLAGDVSMRLAGTMSQAWRSHTASIQDFTMVDLFHLPHETFLKEQGFDFVTSESARWPNVARYLFLIFLGL